VISFQSKMIVANTRGEMEMLDIRFCGSVSKENKCFVLKKYKGFQGTIKSIEIGKPNTQSEKLQIASCGLDRYLRLHDVESGQMKLKLYLKSRMNCLLFSHNEPLKPNLNKTDDKQAVDDDQLSSINSEDLATDDLWSDMETIIDTHPNVLGEKSKQKLNKRMEEFASENDDQEEVENEQQESNSDFQFKKPKPVLKNKKIKSY
jgi:ribosome biogenesis protein NSA1